MGSDLTELRHEQQDQGKSQRLYNRERLDAWRACARRSQGAGVGGARARCVVHSGICGHLERAGFTSKEQCQATTSGVAAFCFANPYYRPPPQASDEAVNAPSPGWRAVQLLNEPSRQVGARQSRAVRAKPSASTRERSLGGRLDAGAAGVHVPKQETLTGADVGIRLPAALTPELTGTDGGIRPPAAPELSSPKTPE